MDTVMRMAVDHGTDGVAPNSTAAVTRPRQGCSDLHCSTARVHRVAFSSIALSRRIWCVVKQRQPNSLVCPTPSMGSPQFDPSGHRNTGKPAGPRNSEERATRVNVTRGRVITYTRIVTSKQLRSCSRNGQTQADRRSLCMLVWPASGARFYAPAGCAHSPRSVPDECSLAPARSPKQLSLFGSASTGAAAPRVARRDERGPEGRDLRRC